IGGSTCEPEACSPPLDPIGACCTERGGSCWITTWNLCIDVLGSFNGSGTWCEPDPCVRDSSFDGACCFDYECRITVDDLCYYRGGVFVGRGSTCEPAPCSELLGACCPGFSGSCSITTEYECISEVQGVFQGVGTFCQASWCDPHPEEGACCIEERCEILTEGPCLRSGGTYQGAGSVCEGCACN
ncbi:MAG: hypothetical protein KC729_13015, partial [Candidatus Eisenbacteria bacterium]|nr:hypothetical protein [Candidatus Eisenbacteria bacterium]